MKNHSFLDRPVAVLYQKTAPPIIDGLRKPIKPGGYSDSGADIAHCLEQQGIPVITPSSNPNPIKDIELVFPDHAEGIEAAITAGAKVLWANTVLFEDHPLQKISRAISIVGQKPEMVQKYDDKWLTNLKLRNQGLNVVKEILLSETAHESALGVASLSLNQLDRQGFQFPLVIKPIRGRGSQGVLKTTDLPQLKQEATRLLHEQEEFNGVTYSKYGKTLILENYLPGQEVTLTIMPPGSYRIEGKTRVITSHWSLPPVIRLNHISGIAPYNGVVAVAENSVLMGDVARQSPEITTLMVQCEQAATLVAAVAPIRIDCRQREDGTYQMFDLNMKPNMTGAGRPGRDRQDSLSCIAARGMGWQYANLILNMLAQAWYKQ